MRMKAPSSSVSTFFWLLASVCLCYGVAKPSVWPCRRACKQLQFSDFRSDSPLNFTSFWLQFGDVGEAIRVCRVLVLQSTACCVSACTLQSWTTAGCSSICFSWGFRCLVLRWKSCAHSRVAAFLTSSPFRYDRVCSCSDKCGNRQRRRRSINQSRWTWLDANRVPYTVRPERTERN